MNRLVTLIVVVAVLVLMAFFVYAYRANRHRPSFARDTAHISEYDERMGATNEGPPLIVLSELQKRGLDSARAAMIEPHFHVLNAALVTLLELQAEYDSTTPPKQRALNARAIPFHVTADRHQREIINLLPMPQESIFDNYVQERKQLAGLRDPHTQHREENPLTGLGTMRPPPRR